MCKPGLPYLYSMADISEQPGKNYVRPSIYCYNNCMVKRRNCLVLNLEALLVTFFDMTARRLNNLDTKMVCGTKEVSCVVQLF